MNDILPHLTVAHSTDPAELDRIDAELCAGLPIECAATEAWVMTEADDGWHRHTVLALGGSRGASGEG